VRLEAVELESDAAAACLDCAEDREFRRGLRTGRRIYRSPVLSRGIWIGVAAVTVVEGGSAAASAQDDLTEQAAEHASGIERIDGLRHHRLEERLSNGLFQVHLSTERRLPPRPHKSNDVIAATGMV